MLTNVSWKLRKFGKRALQILLCAMLAVQTVGLPGSALADSIYHFRGYDIENVTTNTFTYVRTGVTLDGTTVIATGDTEGKAVGYIALDEEGYDISTSVDLGSLEIDFYTLTTVGAEGTDGDQNDVPTVTIDFCTDSDIGSSMTAHQVTLTKSDPTVSGGVALTSGVSIPANTRSIYITLTGVNTMAGSDNTVVFSNTSLVIHDAAAPSCEISYDTSWTNAPVTVTISASDADSGLEGIYYNDTKVTDTSPYTFIVDKSGTSFSAYSMDYAGKKSEICSATVNNIDTITPDAPSQVPLSTTEWTNGDVQVLMPDLEESTGAPEYYVYQIGASGWQQMPDDFALTDSGQFTIRVAVQDEAGNTSSSAEATAHIDKIAPTIDTLTQTPGSGYSRVDVTYSDGGLSGINTVRYAEGTQDAAYFAENGTDIVGGTFTVASGGTYTVCVTDNAGNYDLETISVSTAPTLLDIANTSMDEDIPLNVPLNAADAETSLDKLTISAYASDTDLITSITVNQSAEAASIDITPAANAFGGPVIITVEVEDESGLSVSDTFELTVNSVNDPPIAADDTGITVDEDSFVKIDVLANDSDAADGDTLSIVSCGTPGNGTAVVVLGEVKYTPDADFTGEDSFTYTISDGHEGTAMATVYVTVNNVNDPPVAVDDTAQATEDNSVLIDVLENDTDVDLGVVDGEALSIVSYTQGAHGSTAIDEGKIRYTPDTNYNGEDTFTYTIQDSEGVYQSTASVTVTIAPVPDDPWFEDLEAEYSIGEDSVGAEITFSIHDVETSANSLMLQAALSEETLISANNLVISGLGDTDPSISLLLTPRKDLSGDVTITLSLSDGFVTVQTPIIVHITPVNDAPVAGDDTIAYDEDSAYIDIPVSVLLENDTDADGDALRFVEIDTEPSVGTLEQYNETTLRYYPQANYEGDVTFTYKVTDETVTVTGTCTLTVNACNDAPTITMPASSYTTAEDTALTGIIFSIHDEETAAADLVLVGGSSDTDLIPTDGITIVNNGDGTCTLSITPAPDANGTANVEITVSDGSIKTAAYITLEITPTQDKPIAEPDNVYVPLSGKRVFSVLENDHDVDGDNLRITDYDASTLPGTLLFDDKTEKFTYYATAGENEISTFTYTITDETDSADGTVTLDVNSISHPPVISTISNQYVTEDNTIDGIFFTVMDEDYNDTATISVGSSNTTILPTDSAHAAVTDNGDGTFYLALTPAANANGTVTVTVTATDKAGLTDSTTFTLRVIAQNDDPIAVDDELSLDEDTSLVLDILTNDSDPDGDTIWVSDIEWPSHGYLTRSGSTYTYTPYGNWNGTETLTYTISDGHSTDTAEATIIVEPVNDYPVTRTDYATLSNKVGQSVTIDVLHNDYDPDGDTIYTSVVVVQPDYGTAVINADGTITYTRTAASPRGDNGLDTFTYRIFDLTDDPDDSLYRDGTVYVAEWFTGSLYTYGRTVTCFEDDDPFTFDLSVSNPNNVDYELTINDLTDLGTLTVVDHDTVRFTPAANANGDQTISYTVSQIDGDESYSSSIWLTVYPVNDLPVIDSAPTEASCNEDSSEGMTLNVTYHDPDCVTSDLHFYAYTASYSNTAAVAFDLDYSVTKTDDGAILTIIPQTNVSGTAVVTLCVSDGITTARQNVAITINEEDDAPLLNEASTSVYEDISVTFSVLTSYCEVDGDDTVLEILDENQPANGTVTVNANNTLTYTPDPDFYGTDTFYFTLTDQTDAKLSTSKLATVYVTPINDQPEIYDLDYYQTTLEDNAKEVTLTVHDVDNDLSAASCYTLSSSNTDLVPDANISISQVAGEEMKITVTPVTNAYGTTVISIIASDGSLTAIAAFELKVISVNDTPVAVNDTTTVDEVVSTGSELIAPRTEVTIDLTQNDIDIEDETLKIVAIYDVENGIVVNTSDGEVSVSAEGDYTGDVTFGYTVMDSNGATADADVTVTILPQNDPPRLTDDSLTIDEDHSVLIAVLDNDTDIEGDYLTIDSATDPENGSTSVGTGGVDYTPDTDYYGTDTFQYTVSDGHGGTATATVTIKINPVNDAPVIEKHSSNPGDWTMAEDETGTFNFVVSDSETSVSNLLITIVSENQDLLKTSEIDLSTNEDGYKTITVHPEKDMNGVVPVLFKVSDGQITTEERINITITPVNDRPVVDSETYTIAEDSVLNGTITATDPDGDDLTFAKQTDPSHGTVTVNENGTFTYTPYGDFNGSDSFTVKADDGNVDPANRVGVGIISITVTPKFDAPVANEDLVETDEDIVRNIYVLANDTDEDIDYGDSIILVSATNPSHGTAVVVDDYVKYTPDENYNGDDAFSYTISDQDGNTASADVILTVKPVNDRPINGDDTAETDEDNSVKIYATLNDDIDQTTNPDLENLTITAVSKPANGTAQIVDEGKNILYIPDLNYYSEEGYPDTFTYTVEDNGDDGVDKLSNTFNVSVTVNSVNDAPEIQTELADVTIYEDHSTDPITFTVYDVEDAEDTLDVVITHDNSTLLNSLSVTPNADGTCTLTITPKADKTGEATITVTVTDDDDATDTTSFLLTVNAVNDDPVAQDDSATIDENHSVTINVLQNDDVDILTGGGGDTLKIDSVVTPEIGSYQIVSNEIVYIPDASYSTKDEYSVTFGYTMEDYYKNTSSANITVTVTPVNDAPTITEIADVTELPEDTPTGAIEFYVTDEEDDDDTLRIFIESDNETLFPLSNIVVANPDETTDATGSLRTVTVTPAANEFGSGNIKLTVKDAEGILFASTTFNVEVKSVNDVPINGAGNDTFDVYEDVETQLIVLTNDDPDDPSYLSVDSIVTPPSSGTLRMVEGDPAIYYTTNLNSNEADSFVYQGYDSLGDTYYTCTVTINVIPVNDAPVVTLTGSATEYTVGQGEALNGIEFTVSDVDDNTDQNSGEDLGVTITARSTNSILLKDGIKIVSGTGENWTLNLQPYEQWNGTTTVIITADDGDLSGSTSFTFTVENTNDLPVAYDDAFTVNEDLLSTLDVLYNDRDADLVTNPLDEVIYVEDVTYTGEDATVVRSENKKTIQIDPIDNFNGTITFTYTIRDTIGPDVCLVPATVTVTVNQVNDPPVPDNEDVTTAEDTAITINVLDGDTDVDQTEGLNKYPDAEVLSTLINEEGLEGPDHGEIELDGNNVKYTPDDDYNGSDSFDYYCYDGEAKVKATVSVTVTQVNDNPVANTDTVTTDEDTAITIDALHNDTDVDTSEILNLNANTRQAVGALTIETAELPPSAHGSVKIENNKIVYTPATNWFGSETITYTISDNVTGDPLEATGTVNVTVTSVNDKPTFTVLPSSLTFDEDHSDSTDVTVTDVETDDGELVLSYVDSDNTSLVDGSCVSFTTVENGERTITVTPKANQHGEAEITVKVTDGYPEDNEGTITFTVTVNGVNDDPVGENTSFTMDEDSGSWTITGTSVTSDVDIATDGDILTLSVLEGAAAHGLAEVVDGNLVYTPYTNYNGSDEYIYTVSDDKGGSDTGKVTITVNQVNDPPVPDNEDVTTAEDTAITINVLDGDTDVDQTPGLNKYPDAEVLSTLINEEGLEGPDHGEIELDGNNVKYTPDDDYNGSDSFDYYCYDGEAKVKATVSVTVTQVNDNPVANTDTVTTAEDTVITIDALANDTDVDTSEILNLNAVTRQAVGALTIETAELPPSAHGSVKIENNKIVYTPETDWFGSEIITYTISDNVTGDPLEATGTVNVTVTSVNDKPTFTVLPSSLTFDEDHSDSTDVTVTDVETDDGELVLSYVDSDNTSLVDGSCVSFTTVENGERTITVTPKANQHGEAEITVKVTDGYPEDNEGTITFTVTVNGVNDDPVGENTSFTMDEDDGSWTITGTSVTSDVDIATDGDILTLSVLDGAAAHGLAEVVDGNLVYTPYTNYNGSDEYIYTVSDDKGGSDTGKVSITVNQVNDLPVPDNEDVTTDEDTAITVNVLDGDTDVDQTEGLNKYPDAEVLSTLINEEGLEGPDHGEIELDGNNVKYTPDDDYNGSDSFDYYCYDGEAKVKATVSVTVTQVNDDPKANPDSAETPDETPVSVDVLANDTDVDTGYELNKDVQHDASRISVTDYYFIEGSHGTLSEENGVITYTPSLNFTGTQKIEYVISDGYGGTATGLLTVLVDVENDPPQAYDDTLDTAEDTPKTINVLDNDTDQDPGDTLSFVGFITETSGLPGSFETNSNGNVTFTPDANYHGSFTVTYQMRDAAGLYDTATIDIDVSKVNDTPQADSTEATTPEDIAKAIDVSGLIRDADIETDGDTLRVTVETDDTPENGGVSVDGTIITYTPDTNWNGTDEFYYTVTDDLGASARAHVTVTVTQVNDAPVAVIDNITTNEDTSVTLNPVANDTDVDTNGTLNEVPMDAPMLVSVGSALHGDTSMADGQVTYTPKADYNGDDSFTYTISDGTISVNGTVNVTVTQVNDQVKPVADEATTTDEDAVTIDVLANDYDVDNDPTLNLGTLHSADDYKITMVGNAKHGTTKIVDEKIVYTPEDTYNGPDSFTYTMTDGHGSIASSSVSVTVLSENDPPDTPVVSAPVDGDKAGGDSIVHVVWSCFDIDGDVLSYTLEYYNEGGWIVADSGLTAEEYDFAIPSSVGTTDGLKFRVKAQDSEFTTDYGYSGAMSVDRDAPVNAVVSMKTADGNTYTEGTWTNQTVTVTAVSAEDKNDVTFQYALDGGAYSDVPNMSVTSGEHNVYILATDEFSNSAQFGGYLARVDKQAPAVPATSDAVDGGTVVITLKLKTDPGGSGNDRLVLPNGKSLTAATTLTYSVTKNGTYTFTLYDVAGNKTTFSYTVSSVDTTQPVITARYGTYKIGETTQDDITVSLSFTDDGSEITARGYELSESAAPSGIYRDYTAAIVISGEGTYYVHAYAMNAFGLSEFETFGPFVIEAVPVAAAAEATVTPTPEPTAEPKYGDVKVTTEDIQDIPGETVYIRLPGEEWGETLTLENVSPGEYYIEAMDDSGNIHTVKVRVTVRDIIARSLRNAGSGLGAAEIAGISAGLVALLLLIFLLAGYNITFSSFGFVLSEEKRLRKLRRVMFRKETLVIRIRKSQVGNADYGILRIAKHLTKRMRNRTIAVEIDGREVLRELIPEDMDKAFKRKISLGE